MKERKSFLNTEPLNTEHLKNRLIAIPNRKCLTYIVKQSACKELTYMNFTPIS
jgi:hypothetical protein